MRYSALSAVALGFSLAACSSSEQPSPGSSTDAGRDASGSNDARVDTNASPADSATLRDTASTADVSASDVARPDVWSPGLDTGAPATDTLSPDTEAMDSAALDAGIVVGDVRVDADGGTSTDASADDGLASGSDGAPDVRVDGPADALLDAASDVLSDGAADARFDVTSETTVDGGVASGLVLHYNFDETDGTTAIDQSGHGRDGTLSDRTARTPAGRLGRALALDATRNQFVAMPRDILVGLSDVTIAAWVNLESPQPWSRLYDFGQGAPVNHWAFLTPWAPDPAGLQARFFSPPLVESTVQTNASLPLGVWKHVAVTAQGAVQRIYIDGAEAARLENAPTGVDDIGSTQDNYIGRSRFPDPYLDGLVDDFRIYDRALGATELLELVGAASERAIFGFDEGTGTVAQDLSAQRIQGSLRNGATWTAGKSGQALSLPAASESYVELDANPLAGCDEMTVAVWVNLNASGDWNRILDFGDGSRSFMFLTPRTNEGHIAFDIAPEGFAPPAPRVSAPVQLTLHEWHHVGVTLRALLGADGGGAAAYEALLYVDGVQQGTARFPVGATPRGLGVANENYLGKSRFPDAYFDGAMDELRFACRALTAGEMKVLAFR